MRAVLIGVIAAGASALLLGATAGEPGAAASAGPVAPAVVGAAAGGWSAPLDAGASAVAPLTRPRPALAGRLRPNPAHDKARRAKLRVIDSPFGAMLADRNGHALYLFTRDRPNRSRCRRGCANAWPPLKTKRSPRVGDGLDSALIGTTKRRNGSKQVTYNGHPVYFYVDDRKPGQVRCQDIREFGGTWLVVSPDGEAIR